MAASGILKFIGDPRPWIAGPKGYYRYSSVLTFIGGHKQRVRSLPVDCRAQRGPPSTRELLFRSRNHPFHMFCVARELLFRSRNPYMGCRPRSHVLYSLWTYCFWARYRPTEFHFTQTSTRRPVSGSIGFLLIRFFNKRHHVPDFKLIKPWRLASYTDRNPTQLRCNALR
jgi:hypothetical protein